MPTPEPESERLLEDTGAIPEPKKLAPNQEQPVPVGHGREYFKQPDTVRLFGVIGTVWGDVEAGKQHFFLTDVSEDPRFTGGSHIVMTHGVQAPSGEFEGSNFAYVPENGEPITLGRASQDGYFHNEADLSMSWFQAQVEWLGDHWNVRNLYPKNATVLTWVQTPGEQQPAGREHAQREQPQVVGGKTERAVLRILKSPNYRLPDEAAPYGYYYPKRWLYGEPTDVSYLGE
jgi:hypothetical protein